MPIPVSRTRSSATGPTCATADRDAGPRAAVHFRGVVEEVADRLHESRAVALHPDDRRGQRDGEGQTAALDPGAMVLARALDHDVGEIDALAAGDRSCPGSRAPRRAGRRAACRDAGPGAG